MGLVSAEEFKRRRDIIEKGITSNVSMIDQSNLKKRKPLEGISTQSLLRSKNIGQLSFAEEEGEEIPILPKKKKPGPPKEPTTEVIEEAPKQPKPKINLLEEDEETKRLKQEAIEVNATY